MGKTVYFFSIIFVCSLLMVSCEPVENSSQEVTTTEDISLDNLSDSQIAYSGAEMILAEELGGQQFEVVHREISDRHSNKIRMRVVIDPGNKYYSEYWLILSIDRSTPYGFSYYKGNASLHYDKATPSDLIRWQKNNNWDKPIN